MTKQEAQKLGSLNSGLKARKEALERYYENPNVCQTCGVTIIVRSKQSASEAKKRKFCSRSCSAIYTGHEYPKRVSKTSRETKCGECGRSFALEKSDKSGYFKVRKFCDDCRQIVIRRNSSLNGKLIEEKTKDEVFSESKTTWHARNMITRHARFHYFKSGKTKQCATCGYTRHVEVCHLRDVSDFPGTAMINEINSLKNLVPLCPTHHWELDNGFLDL
jgi:hypothetical protein